MLTLWGTKTRFCDGLSRREFLQIGALGGALTLADRLRLHAQGRTGPGPIAPVPNKSVIMIHLVGGPAQLDTYDLKPDLPVEYRGEFRPIQTNVAGIQICEHFPRQAALMDKLTVLRSLAASPPNGHTDSEIVSGYNEAENLRAHHPSFGAVVSRLRGPSSQGVPPYITLRAMSFPNAASRAYEMETGYLGVAHRPFIPTGPGMADLTLTPGVSASRLHERTALLDAFDQVRRDLDASGTMSGLDAFQGRALELLTSSALRNALDLSKEDPRVVDRYSLAGGPRNYGLAPGHSMGTQLLLARRLVEAGAGFVSVALGYWDTHGGQGANDLGFHTMRRKECPLMDKAFSALVEDLHQRGLDKDVLVIAWGEFGRTPRINPIGGREHWLPVMSAVIAGGGLKTGQVIGSSDARGEFPKDRPYRIAQVLATIYQTIGIDPAMTFPSNAGRPMHILDDREPIAELL
jgi:hypothetical protein